MTYQEAVDLYNEASAAKPTDFLFDGRENINGMLSAAYNAFGIVRVPRTNFCHDCVHNNDGCPFAVDDIDEDYEDCNFYEEG